MIFLVKVRKVNIRITCDGVCMDGNKRCIKTVGTPLSRGGVREKLTKVTDYMMRRDNA